MAWSDHCDKYGLTPTEAKLFEALLDGEVHLKDELQHGALGIKFADGNIIGVNMYRMRGKLKEHGITVVGNRRLGGYRLVMPEATS